MATPFAKSGDAETHASSLQVFLQKIGGRVIFFFKYLGGVGLLSAEAVHCLFIYPLDFRQLFRQIYDIGYKSLSLTNLIAVFTGMVLALQFIVGLKRFGLELYSGQVVGLAITRELGPVLTALMVASRVGAGIASELGSMTVSEQILAIRAMGKSPVAQLVVPRLLVTTLATPLLTVFAIIIGILGGMLMTVLEAGVTAQFYLDQIQDKVQVYDYFSGIAKTVFFGFFIGAIASYEGLAATGGTTGVGRATNRAVVYSSVAIFVGDFFLTKLFLLF